MRAELTPGTNPIFGTSSAAKVVFISYSRDDKETAGRIKAGLEQHGHSCWQDVSDILPADDWMNAIREGIDASQAFVFLLSPTSLASKVCIEKELSYALAARKRIVPVVIRDFQSSAALPELLRLNYILLREGDDFERGIAELVKAVDTDLDHVRIHTQYLSLARLWDQEKRPGSRLLRGNVLKTAQHWLSGIGDKEPPASQMQIDFIRASAHARSKWRRLWTALTGLAACMVVVLAGEGLLVLEQQALAYQNRAMRSLNANEFPQTQMLAAKGLERLRPVEWVPSWGDAGRVARKVSGGLTHLANGISGKPLSPFPVWCAATPNPAPEIKAAVLSLDSQNHWTAAASTDGEVRIWALDQNQPQEAVLLPRPNDSKAQVVDLALSPDGQWQAAAYHYDGRQEADFVRIWRVKNPGAPVPEFEETARLPHPSLTRIGWAAYSTRLVSVGTKSVLLWNVAERRTVWPEPLPLPSGNDAHGVAISPDGRYIGVACSKRVVLVRTDPPALVNVFAGKNDDTQYTSVDFSSIQCSQRIVAAGNTDRMVSIWKWRDEDVGGKDPKQPLIEKAGHDYPVLACKFSPDGEYLATGCEGGQIRLWRLDSLPELPLEASILGDTPETGRPRINTVAFSADSQFILSGQGKGSLRLWHLGRLWSKELPGKGNVEGLDCHVDGTSRRLVTGRLINDAADAKEVTGEIRFVDLENPERADAETTELILPGRQPEGFVLRLRTVFSPDGKLALVFCRPVRADPSGSCLLLFNAKSGKLIRKSEPPKTPDGTAIKAVCAGFAPRGRRIVLAERDAACYSASIDWTSGTLPKTFVPVEGTRIEAPNPKRDSAPVWDLAVSPDGSRGAVVGEDCAGSFVHLFDLLSGKNVRTLHLSQRAATSVEFPCDNNRVAVGNFWDYSIHDLHFPTGKPVRKPWIADTRGIMALAFNDDGSLLASGHLNRVKIWDWQKGEELRSIWAHGDTVQALVWSGERDELISGAEDGKLKLWHWNAFTPNWAAYEKKGWLAFDKNDPFRLLWNPEPAKIEAGFVNLPPDSPISLLPR